MSSQNKNKNGNLSWIIIAILIVIVIIMGGFFLYLLGYYNSANNANIATEPTPTQNVDTDITLLLQETRELYEIIANLQEEIRQLQNENAAPQTENVSTPAEQPAPTQPQIFRRIPLFSQPFLEVGNASDFRANGDEHQNTIQFLPTLVANFAGGVTYYNHVVYELETFNNAVLQAILNPIIIPGPGRNNNEISIIYTIIGDGITLYTSPIMHSAVLPIPIEVDVLQVQQLRIEIAATLAGFGNDSIGQQLGLENAVIIVSG
ncbi:MAG: hypothetical protein FWG64_02155 [Firmicutes bacterium]|nr:hypothetical protein [Bacillota bacterium]